MSLAEYWPDKVTWQLLFSLAQNSPNTQAGCAAVISLTDYRRDDRLGGLRRISAFNGSCNALPNGIHVPALDLWLWLASEFEPEHIYLCGSWARNGKEFGSRPDYTQVLSVDDYFLAGRNMQQKEIVRYARRYLSRTKVHSLPHPSFWEWRQKTSL